MTTTNDHSPAALPEDEPKSDQDVSQGLTDDQRVSREDEPASDGARVNLGPADLERVNKTE